MVYFCADDYGLCEISSNRIEQCANKGVLNKISIFPNFEKINIEKLPKNTSISLHLNLVEGKCMANAEDISLIANKNGVFKHTFAGLFKLNLFQPEKFKKQVYVEIKEQILFWKKILPDDIPFLIDSHQHTHMIPSVFKAILKVLEEENINLHYMRIPAEPILPYIKTPSLYFTYSFKNLIKQWLLKFLWCINKISIKKQPIPTAYFFGVLFSGMMDEKRVRKILPEYLKLSKKRNKDVEVLFHPGYVTENEIESDNNLVFNNFYLSENRKTEFNTAMKISMKEE